MLDSDFSLLLILVWSIFIWEFILVPTQKKILLYFDANHFVMRWVNFPIELKVLSFLIKLRGDICLSLHCMTCSHDRTRLTEVSRNTPFSLLLFGKIWEGWLLFLYESGGVHQGSSQEESFSFGGISLLMCFSY